MAHIPFQLRIADLLLLTALAASIIAAIATRQPAIAFIMASCLLAFIWNRRVLLRLWTVDMAGLRAGVFAAGCAGFSQLIIPPSGLIGWGAGMVLGSLFGLRDVRRSSAAAVVKRRVLKERCKGI